MSEPFLGQLAVFPFNFAPYGWAVCDGSILPIQQYAALFSLLGTQFGGNGTSNFGLPDLRGRVANGQGQGPALEDYVMGDMSGEPTVSLTTSTIPPHTHAFPVYAVPATTAAPAGALPAQGPHIGGRGAGTNLNLYAGTGTAVALAASQLPPVVGGGVPHNNMQPSLALTWCIALTGVFPARP